MRRARYSILAFIACDCTLLLHAKSPGGGGGGEEASISSEIPEGKVKKERERERSALTHEKVLQYINYVKNIKKDRKLKLKLNIIKFRIKIEYYQIYNF